MEEFYAQYMTMKNKIGEYYPIQKRVQYLKKPTITEKTRLNRLGWFRHVERMEENRIPKKVLYMNLGTKRLRGRPRNKWQD
jgi:hypothetical protein